MRVKNQPKSTSQNIPMKQFHSMKDAFIHELRDIYDAEKQLLKALPEMEKKAASPDLKAAFREHCEQTEEQVRRLEQCFEKLGEKASATSCKAMKGIIAEGEDLLKQKDAGDILDAALIGAAQKAEHYEIATYGTLAEWAKGLGETAVKDLLGKTLSEEEETDELLTKLARGGINRMAKSAA